MATCPDLHFVAIDILANTKVPSYPLFFAEILVLSKFISRHFVSCMAYIASKGRGL